jgi:hypothetical protein
VLIVTISPAAMKLRHLVQQPDQPDVAPTVAAQRVARVLFGPGRVSAWEDSLVNITC